MKLTPAIQEALLSLICYEAGAGGGSLVRSLVPVDCYDVYFRDVAAAAHDYWDRYNKPPGEHTLDLFDVLRKREPDDAEIYTRIYESLLDTAKGVNREYVIHQAGLFARWQNMRRAAGKVVDLLKEGDEAALMEAEAVMSAAPRSHSDVLNYGIRLNDPAAVLPMLEDDVEVYPMGIKQLDEAYIGPFRGGLMVFVAPPNKGKSWFLVHQGRQCLLNRLKVCHISCEMSEREVTQRYLQSVFSMTKRKSTGVDYYKFETDDLGAFTSFNPTHLVERPALKGKGAVKHLRDRYGVLSNRAPLIVKQFPSGELTLRQLDAYLDALESVASFIPDIVLVDYADEMAVPSSGDDKRRLGLAAVYRGLRGIAVRRNIAVVTASQSNRAGASVRWLTRKEIAEDWTKIAIADDIVTYSQTEVEEEMGLARLFIDKTRSEHVSRRKVLVSQAYAVGQFCMDSVWMGGETYWRGLKEEAGIDDEDDQ